MRALTLFSLIALLLTSTASWSQSGRLSGPNEVVPDRYIYYPGTEVLDEFSKKFDLENQDWRKQRPWYEPTK